jgi:signal transduction histidine kinase
VVDVFYFLKPAFHVRNPYERQVHITNILSFIFCWVTLGILAIFYTLFGWLATLPFILSVALLFLLVPIINRWGNHRLGRMIFCLIPVWLTMFVTIYFKLNENLHTYILYFDSRFILMATPVLPGIVFRLKERPQLFICIGSSALLLLFYDPIHELFEAGYFQKGFRDPSYYYISYIVGIAYSILVFGILLLRSVLERSEARLEFQNRELQQKQHEIEAQHEELLQHQEEMMTNNDKLEEANAVILKQQAALEKYNTQLENLVAEKSQELMRTNEELIKHNNELIQFSYTVSHNLRGPVARLLGLTRLFKGEDRRQEKEHLESLVVRSSEELDGILKDLSLIIDIRNEIYRLREKVFLEEEWRKAIALLGDNIRPEHQMEVDFTAAPHIFGVRPMIHSILYNLASNAIKYQSPDRLLHVRVSSYTLPGEKTIIEVRDNGLGIDLKAQGHNMFKLYKRFHSHVAGKGLGLYLVKTQVEALNGTITVESQPDQGAVFRIMFVQPEEISRQVFHESEVAQLCFDAHLRVIIIDWKRNVTSAEYRNTFEVLLHSLRIYKTSGWISDVRKQGVIDEEDYQWMIQTLISEAFKYGLRRVALVGFNKPERLDRDELLKMNSLCKDIDLRVFNTKEEALEWMKEIQAHGPLFS